MLQKYGYFILISIMSLIILILSLVVDMQYKEISGIKNSVISYCDDSYRCAVDSIIIINFIKQDTYNEEIIRKCDRVIEYMSRSRDFSQKIRESLLTK